LTYDVWYWSIRYDVRDRHNLGRGLIGELSNREVTWEYLILPSVGKVWVKTLYDFG
jgi:hypothetical protein